MSATTASHHALVSLRQAALDKQPISGLTHRFYRYPARFSPAFARACIEAFSAPGDFVLDPLWAAAPAWFKDTEGNYLCLHEDI